MSNRGGNTSSLYKLCMAPPSCPPCKHTPSPCASTKSSSCQWNRTQRNSPFRHRSTAAFTSFEILNGNGTQTVLTVERHGTLTFLSPTVQSFGQNSGSPYSHV